MAFRMKGSPAKLGTIKGTEKHSALLAEAEMTRTHGGDPALGQAAEWYGKSMIPDVIDYTIKKTEIEWDKKEEEEKDPKKKKKIRTERKKREKREKLKTGGEEEVTTEEEIELTKIPIIEAKNLTVNEKKIEIARVDEEAAKKRLEEAARKRYERLASEMKELPIIQPQLKPVELEENIIKPKKYEPIEKISTTGAVVQKIGGVSTQNLKTSYTKEEQERLIFSEEHGRMVLPEEIGITPDVIIDQSKLERKHEKQLVKAVEGKPQQKRNAYKDQQYKNASTYIQAQMRRRNPDYPWPELNK